MEEKRMAKLFAKIDWFIKSFRWCCKNNVLFKYCVALPYVISMLATIISGIAWVLATLLRKEDSFEGIIFLLICFGISFALTIIVNIIAACWRKKAEKADKWTGTGRI